MSRSVITSKPILAFFMVLLMSLSGCTGVVDNEDDTGYTIVPVDLEDSAMRSAGSPMLTSYLDCNELEVELKNSIEEETRTNLLQAVEDVYYWGGMWLEDDMAVAESSDGATSSSPQPRQKGTDFSGTNNQEQGVDEADFVKTDGYHIYFVDDGLLHIMDVPEFGEIEHASTTEIEGNPVAMMLNEN